MQTEMRCNETMANDCQAEHDSKAYEELIHCHHSNRRASDCSQPHHDVDISYQSQNVYPINDVTDTSDRVNCSCGLLASSQAKYLKQDAEYLKTVALDAGNDDACSYSKPSSYQANCRDQHDNEYHKLFASDFRKRSTVDKSDMVIDSDNVTDSSNVSDSAQNTPTSTIQAMSDYATIAESTDVSTAPAVYSEINPSHMNNEIVPESSTSTSSFAVDIEDLSLSSQSSNRRVPLKQLCAVVFLMVLLLVLAAASAWLLLQVDLLSQPSYLADKGVQVGVKPSASTKIKISCTQNIIELSHAVTVAFCAIRHRPFGDLSDEVIDFDAVSLNDGLAFGRSQLSVRQRSYYWLAASAELGTNNQFSLLLQQQRNSPRTATEHAPLKPFGFFVLNQQFNLSVSLFDIRHLDTDDTVYLTKNQIVDFTSAANETTVLFIGFSINGIFDQLFARKYEIDSTMMQQMTAIDGASVYYTVSKVLSSHEAERKLRTLVTLQVPVSGVYLMTASIHCTTRRQFSSSSVKVGSNNRKALFVLCSSVSNSSMTALLNMLAGLTQSSSTKNFDMQNDYVASSSALVNLPANNDQFVFLDVASSPDVSLVRYAVQLVLYKPVNADKEVAWSVIHASPTLRLSLRETISVKINEGGAYNNVSNRVIVPMTGVYYLMLTVNAPVTSPCRHRVMLNANITALENSRRASTVHTYSGFGTTDKSIMLSLATGDVLTFHFSELSTSILFQACFSGFLLYPK